MSGLSNGLKLIELQPTFLVVVRSNVERLEVDEFGGAHGVMFLCPRCRSRAAWRRHSVVCWFLGRQVPAEEMPTWHRWSAFSGTGYGDLSIDGRVWVRGGCQWSGWIWEGVVKSKTRDKLRATPLRCRGNVKGYDGQHERQEAS